jgi:hypothetical protein
VRLQSNEREGERAAKGRTCEGARESIWAGKQPDQPDTQTSDIKAIGRQVAVSVNDMTADNARAIQSQGLIGNGSIILHRWAAGMDEDRPSLDFGTIHLGVARVEDGKNYACARKCFLDIRVTLTDLHT